MSNDVTTKISFEVDQASLNKARGSYKVLGDDLNDYVKAQEKAEKQQRALAKRQAEDREFEQSVRRQSYDVSGGDSAGGAGGGAGFNKLESGINAISSLNNGLDVGNIIGAVDGVLDFGEGIKTLPNAFSNVLSFVNPVTAGLAGVGVALALLSAQTAENAEKLRARLEANKSVSELVASGATSSDIQERIRATERLLEAEEERLEQNKRAYEQYANADPITGTFLRVFDQAEEELSSAVNQGADSVLKYQEEIRALTGAMDDAEVAANDYAQAILQQSELTKQAILTEFEANERTAEQNRERLRQINVQIEATQAQLDVLKGAEIQSAETTTKIAELEAQLKGLGQEADITAKFTKQTSKDIENTNKEREAEAKKSAEEATRLAEDTQRKQQESLEQQAQALQQFNDKMVDIATKNAEREEDIARSLKDNQSDIRRKLAQDLKSLDEQARLERTNLIVDSQQEEAKSAREHQRTLKKIQEDAQRQREDLSANLDFAGLFNLEKNLNQQLSDEAENYDAQRQERQIALEESLADLRTNAVQQRRERQAQFQQEIADARLQADRQLRDQRIAKDREIAATQKAYDRQYELLQQKFAKEEQLYTNAGKAQNKAVADSLGGNASGGSNLANRGVGSLSTRIGNPPLVGGGSVLNRNSVSNTTNAPIFNIDGARDPKAVAMEVRLQLRNILGL